MHANPHPEKKYDHIRYCDGILYQSNKSVENEIKGVKTLLEAQVDGIMASLSLETDAMDETVNKSCFRVNVVFIVKQTHHVNG